MASEAISECLIRKKISGGHFPRPLTLTHTQWPYQSKIVSAGPVVVCLPYSVLNWCYKPGQSYIVLDWSGLPTLVYANSQMRALARRIRLGGSGGMLPQGNFLKLDALRRLLRPFLGLKNITQSLRFSPGTVTEF